jgi:hypothetical protein
MDGGQYIIMSTKTPIIEHPTANTKWMVYAACADINDPDIFFPDLKNTDQTTRFNRINIAWEICYKCPVKKACETYSESMSNGWGIWGERVYDKSDRRNSA